MNEKFSGMQRDASGKSFAFATKNKELKVNIVCVSNKGEMEYELFWTDTKAKSVKMWPTRLDPGGYFAGKVFDLMVALVGKGTAKLSTIYDVTKEIISQISSGLNEVDGLRKEMNSEVDKVIKKLMNG